MSATTSSLSNDHRHYEDNNAKSSKFLNIETITKSTATSNISRLENLTTCELTNTTESIKSFTDKDDGGQVRLTTATTCSTPSATTTTTSTTTGLTGLDYNTKDLKILNHLKNIEKINEKRRVFLNSTVVTPPEGEGQVSTNSKLTINGDNDHDNQTNQAEPQLQQQQQQQQQQRIHTILEDREEIEVNGINKHGTTNQSNSINLSIKYATLPKQTGGALSTTTTSAAAAATTTTSPLKSPSTPPPKPPMLSRTRSIGFGDNRSSSPASPPPPPSSSSSPSPTKFASITTPSRPLSATGIQENNTSIETNDEEVQLRKNQQQHHHHHQRLSEKATTSSTSPSPSSSPPTKERPSSTISSALGQPISPKHYEALVEQLRCPGCANAMKAPILLCKSGHSICDQCTRILLMCPLCKETFTNNRSLTVEALCAKAHFRCSHAAGGCTVRMPIALLDWHEKQCVYKPMKCFMGRVWNDCQWYGREIQWKEHLELEHANKVFNSATVNLIWNMGTKQKPLTGYYVFQVHDEMFNFYEIYDRERVLFTMTCTSSFKEKKYNFAYEVTLIHPNNDALAITQKFPVHSEYDNDILMDGTCVSIAMSDLHKFIDDDKLLHYTVKVLVVKSPRKPFTADSNVRKSFPLNYQQTQFECGNIKSVSSDLIITRKMNASDRNSVPYADADGSNDTSPNKLTNNKPGGGDSGSENDTEFNLYVERNWGTPQLHFNRKYLKSSPNNSCSPDGDSQLNDELGPLRTANMQLDDKVSLCSTNISYTKKVSNTLRKSFRALKTDLIEMKPFSKKSPEKNSEN